MRKVTQEITRAFINGEKKTIGNSSTNGQELFLHGNEIAKRVDGKLFIQNCGWFSSTTKERLNGLPGVRIQQKKGVWYLNGKEWNGEYIQVS